MSYSTTKQREALLQPSMIERLQRVGYYLLPRTHDTSPGHTGLLIMLRPRPHPEALADPESLHLRLQVPDGTVHWTTMDAETPFSQIRTVSPGRIHVFEHDGGETGFFTFGGTLAAEKVDSGVVYMLFSPAPILYLAAGDVTFGSHLAREVEAKLAQEHAQSGIDDQTFLRRLVDAEPQQLYITLLDKVLSHYEGSPALRRGNPNFYHDLEKEKNWLVESSQWPMPLTRLSDWLRLRS